MPARIQPSSKASNPHPEGPQADFRKTFLKHIRKATRVAMEYRRGRPRMLDVDVRWERGPDEDDDTLADDITARVFEAIERDSDGGPWVGRAYIFDDNAERKAAQLDIVELRLEGAEAPTRDDEVTSIIASTGKFIEGVTKQLVAILAATAGERQAVADLVGRVAKHDSELVRGVGKWAYKTSRDEQETERLRIRENNKTTRSATRWDNLEDAAEKYHDVVKQWSDFLLDDMKSREKSNAPTQAEVDAVFAGEAFDRLRAIASEMLATPDRETRMQLAADFKSIAKALSPQQQAELKLRALQVLKTEARARECFKWLTNPRSNPTRT